MKQIIRYITEQLSDLYDADESQSLAWWVLEEMTGLDRTRLQLCGKDNTYLQDLQVAPSQLDSIISRLRNYEPIQYIFGHTEWYGLDLSLSAATLIPRPETAELVDWVSRYSFDKSSAPLRVLDIGTGSGCIALSLKYRHPEWSICGMDVSVAALDVARENGRKNQLEVEWLQGDILSNCISDTVGYDGSKYDVVVSNPPYICEQEKAQMRSNVLSYEPKLALFVPDDNPLLFYRRIAQLHIAPCVFFEINELYAKEMVGMLQKEGYKDIQIKRDIYGKTRFVTGRIAR